MFSGERVVVVPHTEAAGEIGTFELDISSESELKVSEPKDFQRKYSEESEWYQATSGGSEEFVINNPQYLLSTSKPLTCHVILSLVDPTVTLPCNVGLYVLKPKTSGASLVSVEPFQDSSQVFLKPKFESNKGGFISRQNYSKNILIFFEAFVNLDFKEEGKYVLVPCTQQAGVNAEFKMTILSNSRLKLSALGNISHRIKLQGEWNESNSGGCINYATWRLNPQFMLHVHEKVPLLIRLKRKPGKGKLPKAGFYLALNDSKQKKKLFDFS